jgi:hypothetical protein
LPLPLVQKTKQNMNANVVITNPINNPVNNPVTNSNSNSSLIPSEAVSFNNNTSNEIILESNQQAL